MIFFMRRLYEKRYLLAAASTASSAALRTCLSMAAASTDFSHDRSAAEPLPRNLKAFRMYTF